MQRQRYISQQPYARVEAELNEANFILLEGKVMQRSFIGFIVE